MEELDSNMDNLQKIQESLSTEFNESFASFLYGLLMTMWCVHFPGRPTREQWDKIKLLEVVDGRIAEIKEKLKVSQEENESLRKRLEGNVKKKINFADEATSDSFIMNPASRNAGATNGSKVTKIPLRNARRGVGSGSSQLTEPGLGPGGPNLNQPPRYMRGLFDSTNTRISSANRRQYRDQRPPFR